MDMTVSAFMKGYMMSRALLFVIPLTVIANIALLYIYHNDLIGSWIVLMSLIIGYVIGGLAQIIYNDEKVLQILKEMRDE